MFKVFTLYALYTLYFIFTKGYYGLFQVYVLKCMCTLPCFSVIFTDGNNFLVFLTASLADIAPSKLGLLLKERITSPFQIGFTLERKNYFPLPNWVYS